MFDENMSLDPEKGEEKAEAECQYSKEEYETRVRLVSQGDNLTVTAK